MNKQINKNITWRYGINICVCTKVITNYLSTTITMINTAKNAHFNGNLTLLAQKTGKKYKRKDKKQRGLAKHKIRRI